MRTIVTILLWHAPYCRRTTMYCEGPHLRYLIPHKDTDLETSETFNLFTERYLKYSWYCDDFGLENHAS